MAAGSTTSRSTWWRPERMPEHLVWFKWESYATWLSGFAMLCDRLLCRGGPVSGRPRRARRPGVGGDPDLAGLAQRRWLLYDNLCKSRLAKNPTALMVLLFCILVVDGLGLHACLHRPGGAAASRGVHRDDHVGERVLRDHPEPAIVVADLKAGRTPDPKYGAIAKLRSTHNNYLTLPVLFLMLSNHYPLAFATE